MRSLYKRWNTFWSSRTCMQADAMVAGGLVVVDVLLTFGMLLWPR